MRTPSNHRSPAVLVSALLGWILALTVPAAASRAQAAPDRLPQVETTLRGSPLDPARADPEGFEGLKGNQPGQATGTKPVQAPPLQAPVPTPAPGNPVAVIATSLGDLTVELFKDLAPVSVENFLRYANDGFFDETIFHRVKPRFMIQGGGFTATLTEKQTRPPIQNEATNGLRNTRGTLAMARRASLRSATSQFYINIADNRMLDHTGYSPDEFGYAVFGRVLSGMDVADRIAAVPTRTTVDMEDVPIEPVIIKNVRVVK